MVQEDFAVGIAGNHMFSRELSEAEFMEARKSDSFLNVSESEL